MVLGLNCPLGGGVLLLNDSSALLIKNLGIRLAVDKSQRFGDLYDYKLFHFSNGRIITLVMTDRFTGDELSKTYFDENWNVLSIAESEHPTRLELKKPANFDQMKEFSSRIAEKFPFVRVDFYECSGRLYFGEITFYPNSGFECFNPPIWNKKFGDLIDLRLAYDSD